MTNNTRADEWTGCYDLGWQNLISPAAFSHPAKFSRGLIFRIIEHALEDGLIQPGSIILDPFGGVALGALPALQNGLNWIGVELESKFVELGRQNIALWNSRFSGMPRWTGQAQLLQGDSRRLAEVVAGALRQAQETPGLVVSSPPYADSFTRSSDEPAGSGGRKGGNGKGVAGAIPAREYGSTPGQLATLPPGTPPTAVISSPSFAGNTGGRGEASRNPSTGSGRSVIDAALFDRHSGGMKKGTGSDPANLDHLPMTPGNTRRGMGTPPTAIIASPPYVDSMEKSGGIDPDKSNHIGGPHSQMNRSDTRYGQTDGQLGAMKVHPEPSRSCVLSSSKGAGEVAVVGSPPFEGSIINSRTHGINDERRSKDYADIQPTFYGDNDGQIGATQGQTFWEAAALIVGQCYEILPPNAYAIWVVKNYIKSGREVDFTGQWQALCEACGFETVHEHRAMLVKENGEQETMAEGHDTTGTTTNLLGEEVTTTGKPMANKRNRIQRKSFFRLLAEKNGSPPIDFETILCTRKAA